MHSAQNTGAATPTNDKSEQSNSQAGQQSDKSIEDENGQESDKSSKDVNGQKSDKSSEDVNGQKSDKSSKDVNGQKSDKSSEDVNGQKSDKSSQHVNGQKSDKSNSAPGQQSDKSSSPPHQKSDKSTIEPTIGLRRSRRIKERMDKLTGSISNTANTGENKDIANEPDNASDHVKHSDQDNSKVQVAENDKTDNIPTDNEQSDGNNENDNGAAANTGQLNVTQHGIPKRKKKERSFACEDCDKSFPLVKDLNSHYQNDHPDHVFQCSTCTNTYASRNAQLRHERTHSGMAFACKDCNYTCQFQYELKNHSKRHTGTGLYPCLSRGCGKSFTTKKRDEAAHGGALKFKPAM